MTFNFDFTPDKTRDCILETEERLRDLIDALLRRFHKPQEGGKKESNFMR
jgi:hypothetical protein